MPHPPRKSALRPRAKTKAPPAVGPVPPSAARRPTQSTWHGITLTDDYAWLKAENWRQVLADPEHLDTEIRAYLEAENAYAERAMADTRKLRRQLSREMERRQGDDPVALARYDGPWAYFESSEDHLEVDRICRAPIDGGKPTVVLDCNRQAARSEYFELGDVMNAPDHSQIAYCFDAAGAESFTLRVRDLTSGRLHPDTITGTAGSFAWAADSRTLLYVRLDDCHRPARVYCHRLGTPVADDVLIYQEPDPAFDVSVSATRSGRHILISAEDHITTEVHLVDTLHPTDAPRCIRPREAGHFYRVEEVGDDIVIVTNTGGTSDNRICLASVAAPQSWREIVPERAGRYIVDLVVAAGHIAWLEREAALTTLVVRDLASGGERSQRVADQFGSASFGPERPRHDDRVRLTLSSLLSPDEVIEVKLADMSRETLKQPKHPKGYDPADYVATRLLAPSHDGVAVPVTVLRHRETPLDGSAPVWLYGYGSYGVGAELQFEADRLSLLERGFVYAIAHVRGGDDLGRGWYLAGHGANKLNSILDYLAVCEHLIASGHTRAGRIVAHGDSAGGLLVAAAMNRAPDLFLAVIADVAFLDPLNTLLDATLPLTPGEWAELGNPIESPHDFERIRSYSPYETLVPQAYPHVLAKAGLMDQRVMYWEPAKWVAKLRAVTTSERLVMLATSMTGGHDGATSSDDQLADSSFDIAFALKVAGLADAVS